MYDVMASLSQNKAPKIGLASLIQVSLMKFIACNHLTPTRMTIGEFLGDFLREEDGCCWPDGDLMSSGAMTSLELLGAATDE